MERALSRSAAEISTMEAIFYEQFTKNQSSNNEFLLRLLLIIGSVIAGYGYVLLKIEAKDYDEKIVFFMLLFTEVLLSIYFKVIYDEGYAFRRDQVVVFRMLKKYGLIAETDETIHEISRPFFPSYNPLKNFRLVNGKIVKNKRHYYFWMPAFHNTLSVATLILQLLLYSSFIVVFSKSTTCFFVYPLITLTLITSSLIVRRKHKWLKKIYSQVLITDNQDHSQNTVTSPSSEIVQM